MKKAQINSTVIAGFIIAIFIVVIALFGYKMFVSIQDSNCRAQLTIAEADLKDSVRVKAADIGSREELKLDIPCNADFAFAVDIAQEPVHESFFDYPLIHDSIEGGSKNNLFVVKDDEIVGSFDIGTIGIEYPYYECYRIRGGKIGLMLEGKGRNTGVMQLDPKYDCTFDRTYSTRLSPEDEDDVCEDIGFSDDNCFEDTVVTNRTIDIGDEGEIEVIIDIGSDDDLIDFEYYEELPKCVGQGFIEFFTDSGSIVEYEIDEDGNLVDAVRGETRVVTTLAGTAVTLTIQEPDPLMMWHFSGTSVQEERIQYELSELQDELTSECLRQFHGGVTDTTEEGEVTPTTVSFSAGSYKGSIYDLSGIHIAQSSPLNTGIRIGTIYRSFIQFDILRDATGVPSTATIEKIELILDVTSSTVTTSNIIVGDTSSDFASLADTAIYTSADSFTTPISQGATLGSKTFTLCSELITPGSCSTLLESTDIYFSVGIKSDVESGSTSTLAEIGSTPELKITYT